MKLIIAEKSGARTKSQKATSTKRKTHDLDRIIGQRIRERRAALGITQQGLAELIGVTYQQAHKYEKGINRISVGRFADICTALDLESNELLGNLRDAPVPQAHYSRDRLNMGMLFPRLSAKHKQAVLTLARSLIDEEP